MADGNPDTRCDQMMDIGIFEWLRNQPLFQFYDLH